MLSTWLYCNQTLRTSSVFYKGSWFLSTEKMFVDENIVRHPLFTFCLLLISMFCLFRYIGPFLFCAISKSGCLNFNVVSFSWYLHTVKQFWGPVEATFSSWLLSRGLHCAHELRASNFKQGLLSPSPTNFVCGSQRCPTTWFMFFILLIS